jgi:heme A synthase
MNRPSRSKIAHWLSVLAVLCTLVLIAFGAHVTTSRVGDSDPYWEILRFWVWFREAEGGLAYELNHRKVATLLGLMITVMAVVTWMRDSRKSMKRLGLAALLLVIVQGAFGAGRVKVQSDPALREWFSSLFGASPESEFARIFMGMMHATLAQATLAILVFFAVLSSGWWQRVSSETGRDAARTLRGLGIWTIVVLFAQLMLGAYVRHSYAFHEGVVSLPAVLVHAGFAIVVLSFVAILWRRARDLASSGGLSGPMLLALSLSILQLLLGLFAWYYRVQAKLSDSPWSTPMLLRSAHVVNGAAILALVVWTVCRAHRLMGAKPTAPGEPSTPTMETPA